MGRAHALAQGVYVKLMFVRRPLFLKKICYSVLNLVACTPELSYTKQESIMCAPLRSKLPLLITTNPRIKWTTQLDHTVSQNVGQCGSMLLGWAACPREHPLFGRRTPRAADDDHDYIQVYDSESYTRHTAQNYARSGPAPGGPKAAVAARRRPLRPRAGQPELARPGGGRRAVALSLRGPRALAHPAAGESVIKYVPVGRSPG